MSRFILGLILITLFAPFFIFFIAMAIKMVETGSVFAFFGYFTLGIIGMMIIGVFAK